MALNLGRIRTMQGSEKVPAGVGLTLRYVSSTAVRAHRSASVRSDENFGIYIATKREEKR